MAAKETGVFLSALRNRSSLSRNSSSMRLRSVMSAARKKTCDRP